MAKFPHFSCSRWPVMRIVSLLFPKDPHGSKHLFSQWDETIMNHKPHQTIDFPMDFPIICRIPSIFPMDFPISGGFPGDLPQQLRGSPWRTALSLLRSLPEERTTPEARQIDWGMGMDGTWEVFTQKKPVFDLQKLEVEPKNRMSIDHGGFTRGSLSQSQATKLEDLTNQDKDVIRKNGMN